MDKPVVAFDLVRMFLGADPPFFYAEIVVRTLIIYVYTLVLLRWIGSRTIAQLSTVEFLLVIALGSAVGDVTFYPEVPILHALLVVTAAVLINKGIDLLIYRYVTVKRLVDGSPIEVVRNGIVTSEGLSHRTLAVPELHEMLRLQGIANLGEIAHAYIEAGGQMSVFKRHEPQDGLPLVPLSRDEYDAAAVDDRPQIAMVCCSCGAGSANAANRCANCGGDRWTEACRGAADAHRRRS